MSKVKLILDEKFLVVAAALIKAAKKEVYVEAYLMSKPRRKKPGKEELLYNELLGAMRRGLDCKVILNYTNPENKMIKENVAASEWLKAQGISVRAVGRNRTVHAKMIIVDGVSLILGSHNWTSRAMTRNIEASVQVEEFGVVKMARDKFLELWKDASNM